MLLALHLSPPCAAALDPCVHQLNEPTSTYSSSGHVVHALPAKAVQMCWDFAAALTVLETITMHVQAKCVRRKWQFKETHMSSSTGCGQQCCQHEHTCPY